MRKKIYLILLFSIVILCTALTLAHLIYAVFAYQNSSIIQFIMKEWW